MLCAFAAALAGCELRTSAPVVVSHDNQVVQFLRIRSLDSPGIVVHGFKNVRIENVFIDHGTGSSGIDFANADGITIENVSVVLADPPATGGPLPSAGAVGINGYATAQPTIMNVRTTGSSSGVYLLSCSRARLSRIVGKNMRGPFPRGQCVQFNKSPHSTLSGFHCLNEVGKNVSWTEDNISVFQSDNVTVTDGVIDGNNSPTGDGIMFESGGSTTPGQTIQSGRVERVDTLRQGNGCYGAWAVSGVVFKDVRVSGTRCTGIDGRGPPSSGALVFGGGSEQKQSSSNIQIIGAKYKELCKKNLVWPAEAFSETDLHEDATLVPRVPVSNSFCFE